VVPRAVDLVSQLLAAPSTGEEEDHQREPYHTVTKATFSPVELTVLAHYRGEVYRRAVWRTRRDATTNWAVVAAGLALSLTFSSPTPRPCLSS
jgi:uncharacterized membrane protein